MGAKLGLQVTIGVLCVIPIFFGGLGILQGAERFMPTEIVTPNADSQIRYMFGWYFALPALLIYMIPRIETHTTLLRIIVGAVFFGGLMRLVSMADVGLPDMQRFIVTAIELSTVFLLFWQKAIAKSASR
ncbi:MAG: DUF4345 domain-containing protein [Pseudomonadota bacterium]